MSLPVATRTVVSGWHCGVRTTRTVISGWHCGVRTTKTVISGWHCGVRTTKTVISGWHCGVRTTRTVVSGWHCRVSHIQVTLWSEDNQDNYIRVTWVRTTRTVISGWQCGWGQPGQLYQGDIVGWGQPGQLIRLCCQSVRDCAPDPEDEICYNIPFSIFQCYMWFAKTVMPVDSRSQRVIWWILFCLFMTFVR